MIRQISLLPALFLIGCSGSKGNEIGPASVLDGELTQRYSLVSEHGSAFDRCMTAAASAGVALGVNNEALYKKWTAIRDRDCGQSTGSSTEENGPANNGGSVAASNEIFPSYGYPASKGVQPYDQADARLNASYRVAMRRRDSDGQSGLRQEERAWIQHRNAACGFEQKNECAAVWATQRAVVLEAADRKLPHGFPTMGQCYNTSVAEVQPRIISSNGGRLEGGSESGMSMLFADGHYLVSYDTDQNAWKWHFGEPIRLCVLQIPIDCPAGDFSDVEFKALNLRRNEEWEASDSIHLCGGA